MGRTVRLELAKSVPDFFKYSRNMRVLVEGEVGDIPRRDKVSTKDFGLESLDAC